MTINQSFGILYNYYMGSNVTPIHISNAGQIKERKLLMQGNFGT